MAETLTTRLELPNYSAGTDSFTRADWNSATANIEAWAAYDDGADYVALPDVPDRHAGRYAMHTPAGGWRALYRTTGEGGSWESVLGNTIPAPMSVRPLAASPPATTTKAFAFSHPSLGSEAGWIAYDATSRLSSLTVFDANDAAKGALHVGVDTAYAPSTLGRVHVRTRAAADRALVLRAHASDAGDLLTAREFGGQDIVSITAAGHLRARSLVGLAGAATSAGAGVAIAPTSNPSDGIDIGLLLYGMDAAASKPIMRAFRFLNDSDGPIASIERNTITLGRLPWSSAAADQGVTYLRGRSVKMRLQGYGSASPGNELLNIDMAHLTDLGQPDQPLLGIARNLIGSRAPLLVSQELDPATDVLRLDRVTDMTGRFMRLRRVISGTPEVVSDWLPDGKLLTGARWISSGVTRDARNPAVHIFRRRDSASDAYADEDGFTLVVGGTSSNTYDVPIRSGTTTDLLVQFEVNYQVKNDPDILVTKLFTEIEYSTDGGSIYTPVEVVGFFLLGEKAATGPLSQPGGSVNMTCHIASVDAGTTVKVRPRVRHGGVSGHPPIWIKRRCLTVTEATITATIA